MIKLFFKPELNRKLVFRVTSIIYQISVHQIMSNWKETAELYSSLISRPLMSEKLLLKPPFKYIYDIFLETSKATGFASDTICGEEYSQERYADKQSKIQYLIKIIEQVEKASGKKVAASPLKIVSGLESFQTNQFMQMFFKCATKIEPYDPQNEKLKVEEKGSKPDLFLKFKEIEQKKQAPVLLKQQKNNKEEEEQKQKQKQKLEDQENKLPEECYCPLSLEVMEDPVITADGHTYERKQIQKWFDSGNDRSPLTNLKMESKVLIPNIALRKMIESLKQKNKVNPIFCAVCGGKVHLQLKKDEKQSLILCQKCHKQQQDLAKSFNP